MSLAEHCDYRPSTMHILTSVRGGTLTVICDGNVPGNICNQAEMFDTWVANELVITIMATSYNL